MRAALPYSKVLRTRALKSRVRILGWGPNLELAMVRRREVRDFATAERYLM